MSTLLGGLDQTSFISLDEFLRRGEQHDTLMHMSGQAAMPGTLPGSLPLPHPGMPMPMPVSMPGAMVQQALNGTLPPMGPPLGMPLLDPAGDPHSFFNGRATSGDALLPRMEHFPAFSTPSPSETTSDRTKRRRADPEDDADNGDDSEFRPHVKWTVNEHEVWHRTFDTNMNEIPQPGYRVELDKGFKFSSEDESWICQKKNHFQVTVAVKMEASPAFVATRAGLQKISGLVVNVYGVRLPVTTEASKINLEQSQTDRTKRDFTPHPIVVHTNDVTKLTVGRLHFTETTPNNMRKKGKLNPDQRYFALVVSLAARAGDGLYTLASHVSEKVIVRASNPGLFENESNVHWVKGQTVNSIVHNGPVGINVECPEDALCVRGNIRLSGALLQPSDVRLKTDIAPLDPSAQLHNIRKIGLYQYRLTDSWARTCGRDGPGQADECGVLAQELRKVLPDAVRQSNDVELVDGTTIPDLMVVNKERLFMENVGAVKHLGDLTERLGSRLLLLEEASTTLVTALRRSSSLAELQEIASRVESTLSLTEEEEVEREKEGKETTTSTATTAADAQPQLEARSPWAMAFFFLLLVVSVVAVALFDQPTHAPSTYGSSLQHLLDIPSATACASNATFWTA
eukprot:m.247729 g.247729  ORF g.247729 m.247729 type:complete len:628 (-) comp53036_c0_seq1:387-2270(-)